MSQHERTGWRDEEISRRHRIQWGYDCPAVDVDFLMVEYNHGVPVAIVDYKHYAALVPSFTHPSYRALSDLCGNYKKGELPLLVVFYCPGSWAVVVHPLNRAAKKVFGPDAVRMSERQYVAKMYELRNMSLQTHSDSILKTLSDSLSMPLLDRNHTA